MRLPNQIAFVVLATYTVHAATQVGAGNIKFCYDKDLGGKCTYPMDVSLTGKCRGVEDGDKKFGDTHSSIAIVGDISCRFFKADVSDGCKEPYTLAATDDNNVGDVGWDGRRATRWINVPGIMDWPYDWTFRSYYCVPTSQKTTNIVVAECPQKESRDYCTYNGEYREFSG